jgi:hypothetical protein
MGTREESLMHYGVLGMRWGRRRKTLNKVSKSSTGKRVVQTSKHLQRGQSSIHAWLKEAGKMTLSQYTHPIITTRANNQSIGSGDLKSKFRRRLLYQNTSDIHDVNQRIERVLKDERRGGR